MPAEQNISARTRVGTLHDAALKAIVLGLHWDPPEQDKAYRRTTDLDVLCALFDAQGRVLEVIHPGRTQGGEGAIVHTGDSTNGASTWDDERIFVFLQALPARIARLEFMVANASDRPFDEVRGAICHLSDQYNDAPLLRIDLTTLIGKRSHIVAVVLRGPGGWSLSERQSLDDGLLHATHGDVSDRR